MVSMHSRGMQHTVQSWRDYRTLSRAQRIALDFLTNSGPIFSRRPVKTPYLLYGGAAWGGKSYFLRSAAFEMNLVLRDKGFPNQWGVLLCDTYENLRDRHIAKLDEEFKGIGVVQETTKRGLHFKFHDPTLGGFFLRNVVSSSDTKKGKGSRRGAEFAWVEIDELTELTKEQFGKIMYTARTGWDLPFFARAAATNPDGIGHGWVKRTFVPEYRDLEDELFNVVDPSNFLYVPARKTDNPAYEVMGSVIDQIIAMEADPAIRKARDEGSWEIYQSGRFAMFARGVHIWDWDDLFSTYGIPIMSVRSFLIECRRFGFEVYGSLDYGTSLSSLSVYYLHLVGPDGRAWTFHEHVMRGMEAPKQAKVILELEEELGVRVRLRYADPSIAGKAAEDQSGLTRQAKFLRAGVMFQLAVNDRVEGAATVAAMLDFESLPDGTFIRPPMWCIHRDCKGLIREIPELPRDPSNPEDVDRAGGIWHYYDSARYFLHTRFQGAAVARQRPVAGSLADLRALARAQVKPATERRRW